jgi:hypothetical protein
LILIMNLLLITSARFFSTIARPKTVPEAIQWAKANDVEIVDVRFTDLHGTDHHIQFPVTQVPSFCYFVFLFCLLSNLCLIIIILSQRISYL